jgi:hypothetical protein
MENYKINKEKVMTKDKFEKKEKRQQFNKPQKQIIEFFME